MLLSLCIPTHDGRGWSLRQLIDSILPQLGSPAALAGGIEICVSDNGSQDGTEALLAAYSRERPGLLTCHRFPENVGGRLNMLKVAEMARGEYLWLLGSDDVLEPSAVQMALEQIKRFPQVSGFCFNRTRYNRALTEEIEDFPLHHPENADRHHVYTDADTIVAEMGIYQNYISAVIVKRALWREVVEREGTEKITSYRHFTHSYVHARITVDHPVWAWVPDKIVKYRSDNDAYLATQTSHARFIAEINDDMHRQFRDTLGIRSRGYQAAMRKMFALWWQPRALTQWKLAPGLTADDERAVAITYLRTSWFIPEFWLRALPMLLAPRRLYLLRREAALGTRFRVLFGHLRSGFTKGDRLDRGNPAAPAVRNAGLSSPLPPPLTIQAKPAASAFRYAPAASRHPYAKAADGHADAVIGDYASRASLPLQHTPRKTRPSAS